MSGSSSTSGALPKRSARQRREALAQANRVRAQRAALKTDVKQGKRSLAVPIAEPPEYLASAKVMDILVAMPGYGRLKAERLLERCHVSPNKTFGGLTQRQRRELIEALEK